MNKEEVYEFIKNRGIWYEITEHKAVYSMEDLRNVDIPHPEADAKNLFVRDNKKRNYYLITVAGEKKVDLKAFKERFNTKTLSFASSDDLYDKLKLLHGSVSPLGLLNDNEKKIIYYLDKEFLEKDHLIGVHPNSNTATLWLKATDLIDLIKEHGNEVNFF